MNDERREDLSEVIDQLHDAADGLEEVQSAEQDSLDEMPDGLQSGKVGEKIESNIKLLEVAYQTIQDVISTISPIASKKRSKPKTKDGK